MKRKQHLKKKQQMENQSFKKNFKRNQYLKGFDDTAQLLAKMASASKMETDFQLNQKRYPKKRR